MNYRGKVFVVSVAHVTNKVGLAAAIETGQPPVNNETLIYSLGAMSYVDEFRVKNFDEIKTLDDLKKKAKKVETLDITFVELKEKIELKQHRIDFGEGCGEVTEGDKIILINQDLDMKPDREEIYSFFGRIKGKFYGKLLVSQEKLTLGMQYIETEGRYHKFKLSKNISDASEFKGTSGTPIFDSKGRLVALVAHCVEGLPYIYGFSSNELKKHLDYFIDSEKR